MVGSWFAVLDGGGSLETGGMSAEDPPRAGAWERRKVPQGEPKRPLLFMLSLSPRPGHWLRGAGEGCGRGGPPQDPAWRDRSPQAGRKCGGAAPHPAARLSEGRPCPRRRGHAPGSAPGTPGSASKGYRNPEPALLAAAHGPLRAPPRGRAPCHPCRVCAPPLTGSRAGTVWHPAAATPSPTWGSPAGRTLSEPGARVWPSEQQRVQE